MIRVIEDGKEVARFPHVSHHMMGHCIYLCTFDLDGEFCHVYHDIPLNEDRHPIHNYFNQLPGAITNINFWTLSR